MATDARRLLFHKIHKLSTLVTEVQKRHEQDAHILDDPIAEMQIEIPPQLLKYAYAQQPAQNADLDDDPLPQDPPIKKHNKSPSKPGRKTPVPSSQSKPKERSLKNLPPPNNAVVDRLYAK